MTVKTRYNWRAIFMCSALLVTSCLVSFITWNNTALRKHLRAIRPIEEPSFLVMVQTENCLISHLKSQYAFGNATTCQCDVLVLSFKKECRDETTPEHIKYIFKSNTTWNEGRNLLFDAAKSRTVRYHYYIFVDDDINLSTRLKVNPWMKFLDFLKEIEPAVGILDNPLQVKKDFDARRRLGCGINDTNSVDYIAAPNFDSAFNAFHYRAVDHILPYPTQFDNISWWWSGFYSKIMCDIMFPGQTVVLTKINAQNPQHRKYPRKEGYDPNDWSDIMKAVESRIPEKYQNTKLLQAWKEVGENNDLKSESHCFPLATPHMPIWPFLYLDSR